MADGSENWDDLKLTPDEANRLKEAFENKEFLKLFQDYVEDINSPESREQYEKEIILLEKERGYDVKFIHPDPKYVMKFVSDEKKTFVNVCSNEYVGESVSEKKDGGTAWKIPIILSKPREDLDKKGAKCKVFDVLFHPSTMQRAKHDRRFRGVVEDTALSTIKENFQVYLDVKAAKYPKIKYKGKPPSVVLRRNSSGTKCETIETYCKSRLESQISHIKPTDSSTKPETPKHSMKYRDIVDMKDYSLMGYTDKSAPKEIVIDVQLPKVKNASEIQLDVFERKVTLKSSPELNHLYELNVPLSYAIDKNTGRAQFDKSKKVLNIRLPVKDRGIPKIQDF